MVVEVELDAENMLTGERRLCTRGKFNMVANLAKVSRKGMVASNMIRGAMADFVVFDPHEERLANMLQRVTGLRDPITEFLKAKPEDEAAVGRFKNAIEGLGIGALFDGLFAGVRVIKAKRQARALISGIDEETLVKEMLETTKTQREHIEKFLGNPKLPLFRVEPIKTGRPADVAEALTQAADVPPGLPTPDAPPQLAAERLAALLDRWSSDALLTALPGS